MGRFARARLRGRRSSGASANCSPSGGSAGSSLTVIDASRYERAGVRCSSDVLAWMLEEDVDHDAL